MIPEGPSNSLIRIPVFPNANTVYLFSILHLLLTFIRTFLQATSCFWMTYSLQGGLKQGGRVQEEVGWQETEELKMSRKEHWTGSLSLWGSAGTLSFANRVTQKGRKHLLGASLHEALPYTLLIYDLGTHNHFHSQVLPGVFIIYNIFSKFQINPFFSLL